MVANYVRIVRRSAAVAAIAAAVMVALAAGLAGSKGLAGAAIGVGIVAAFFAISVIVVARAARVSPQAMMVAAFNPRMFGMTAIVCVLVYSAAQVVWSMRLKALYVDPPASASPSAGER